MSIKRKDLIVDYAVGLMIAAFVYISNQTIAEVEQWDIFHMLCNGCFTAGALLLGVGGILFCANKGAFSLFGYSIKFGINLILPLGNNPWRAKGERESYYDYCQRKAEKPKLSTVPLLISGGTYMLLSVVFLLLHIYL